MEEKIAEEDVTFKMEGKWYRIPFYVLKDMSDEMVSKQTNKYMGLPVALTLWLESKNKTIEILKDIIFPYRDTIKAYILYEGKEKC